MRQGWGDMLSQLRSRGIRVLSYINPYLVTNVRAFRPDAQRDLYQEASSLGYLVSTSDGQPYIQTSGSEAFTFGQSAPHHPLLLLLQLAHPRAACSLTDLLPIPLVLSAASW